jgi:hypothetical protein
MARKGTLLKLRKLALATLLSLLAAALAGSTPAPVQGCIITCPPNWCSDCQAQGGQCALVNCQCACITTHH